MRSFFLYFYNDHCVCYSAVCRGCNCQSVISWIYNKCPAIIFAVNRTASVSGRITFLIVSIHTMNGIRLGATGWRVWIRFPAWVRFISLFHIV
jgi:hypothetical protein